MKTKTLAQHVFHPLLAAAILLTAGSVFAQGERTGQSAPERPAVAEGKKAVAGDSPAVAGGAQQITGTVTKIDPKTNTVTVRGEGFDVTLPAGNVGLPKVGQKVKVTLTCSAPPLKCTITIQF